MNELAATNSTAPAEARSIEVITAEINAIRGYAQAVLLSSAVEIGRRLYEAKALLPHGAWGKWLAEQVDFSQVTATRYMKLYDEYADRQGSIFGAEVNLSTLKNLSVSNALRLLAVPAEEREEFAEEHDVENLSAREMEKLIRERDEARSRAEDAEAAKNEAALDAMNARTEKAALENELAAAQEAVRQLEARPIEVAVQEPDPAVIQKRVEDAVKQAEAEAEKTAAAERKRLEGRLAEAEAEKKKLEDKAEKAAADAGEKGELLEALQARLENDEDRKALEKEIGELKKALAMADPGVTAFKTLLAQWAGLFESLTETLRGMDEETAKRLRAALRGQAAKFAEVLAS